MLIIVKKSYDFLKEYTFYFPLSKLYQILNDNSWGMRQPENFEIAPGRFISVDGPCFIVAEIGQNHQGDVDTAKKLIKVAKEAGADCVKFQKSNLNSKFTQGALNRPYIGENSWGATYGEHKAYLEFTLDQYRQLKQYASEIGILLTASAMDLDSIDDLHSLDVPFIKIGSGDNSNFPLLRKAAKTNRPLVISTGMMSFEDVKLAYEELRQANAKFCLLHCVSAYPTPPEQHQLRALTYLAIAFPDTHIGYSGHELGIHASIAAVALGARILERHITLDHNMRGSDHTCSLEPSELSELVRGVRIVEAAMSAPPRKMVQPEEAECWRKLGKSLVTTRSLKCGHVLEESDINIKVADPPGLAAKRLAEALGRTLLVNIAADEAIEPSFIGLQPKGPYGDGCGPC